MTAHAATYYRLTCDGTPAVEDCEPTFIDPDDEFVIVKEDPTELCDWATKAGWVHYDGSDLCKAHKLALATVEHKFTPDAHGSPICGVCSRWAADDIHGHEIPGQLEMPIAVPDPIWQAARDQPCPVCHAAPGQRCDVNGVHWLRYLAADAAINHERGEL